MTGSASSIAYRGIQIELTNKGMDKKIMHTEKFGDLYCSIASGGLTNTGFMYLLYIGGTRAQRDAINALVK